MTYDLDTLHNASCRIRASLLVLFGIFAFISCSAQAQCVNTTVPSCNVYTSCFSELCPCKSSPFEYFETYGKKYCEVFFASSQLSAEGKLWRDSTLRCLQEEIVRALPPVNDPDSCDCKQMQVTAFDTHVACYTQASASICNLPLSDWVQIASSSDAIKNLVDQRGRKQMLEVAYICASKLSGDVKKEVEKVIKKLR